MFAAHCTTTDSAVLLSESSIVAMHRTPATFEIELECHCGERLSVTVDRVTSRPLVAA